MGGRKWLVAVVVGAVALVAAGVIVWRVVDDTGREPPSAAVEVKATCKTMVSVYLPDDDAMRVLAEQLAKDKRVDRLTTETKAQARERMTKSFTGWAEAYQPKAETPLAAAVHLVTAGGVDSYQVSRELPNDYAEVAEAVAASCGKTPLPPCFAIDFYGSEQEVKAVAEKMRADGRVAQVDVLTEKSTEYYLSDSSDDPLLAELAEDPEGPFWMGRVNLRKPNYNRAIYERISRGGDVFALAYQCPPDDAFEETSPRLRSCGNDAMAYFGDNASMRAAEKRLRKDSVVMALTTMPGVEGAGAEMHIMIKPGETGYLEQRRLASELETYVGPQRCMALPHPSLPR